MSESESACLWPVQYPSDCTAYAGLPEGSDGSEASARFEAQAVEFLRRWTSGVFGLCPVSVRPCVRRPRGINTYGGGVGSGAWAASAASRSPWLPLEVDGRAWPLTCGCVSRCDCATEGPRALSLPGPVDSVTAVLIDGKTLDPEAYHVAYRRYLVRDDGSRWPGHQDALAADGAPDTFTVEYLKGLQVPVGGQMAAGALACELAKAAAADPTCALPERVQTVTRQGVTVAVMDAFEDLEKGRTGIWAVDSWLSSVTTPRPNARVASPDRPAGWRARVQ